jgi:hypothetical protein
MNTVKILGVAALALITACSPQSTKKGESAGPREFLPVATIQELMESQIDPAADGVWDSVGTVITAAGEENRQPRTARQWEEVRSKAINLVEATNLLLIPGREVARQAFPSAGPGVFSSADIEHKLATERAGFYAFAVALRNVALEQLTAINHRDVAALSKAGEALDNACESCHLTYWYPHEVIPPLPDFK